MTELISQMQDALQSFRNRGKPACVKMVLTGETPSYLAEGQAGIADEILDIFHEEEREEDAFIWLTAIEDQTDAALSGIERDAFFRSYCKKCRNFRISA